MLLSSSYTRVGSVTTVMYHGTDAGNLPAIMSQGLIPNPKKKVWQNDTDTGINVPSRDSLPGIYLTTNLKTAKSSAGKGSTKRDLIVVVQVQSGNLLADEDDITYRLDSFPGFTNEYQVASLYTAWKAVEMGLVREDQRRQELADLIHRTRSAFVKHCFGFLNYKIANGLNQHEQALLLHALSSAFYVILARKASYITNENLWTQIESSDKIPIPQSGPSEAAFKDVEDRLTRILKRLGRPEHLTEPVNPTARIETPIGYSGKNKIIALVVDEDGNRDFRVVYPLSGEVPRKFIEDWSRSYGPWG